MSRIICFLKFGEYEHMKALARGEMYFSNASNFRKIEENELIRGQGDKLEGGTSIKVKNMKVTDNVSNDTLHSNIAGSLCIFYDGVKQLPVYSLFACNEKDCTLHNDGTLEFHFTDETKKSIRKHFPKADSVAIIKNPDKFIINVEKTIGTVVFSDLVRYFDIYANNMEEINNDLNYISYWLEIATHIQEGNEHKYTINENNVFRFLLCKDIFFENEQEYRFILPKDTIKKGTIYHIRLNQAISVVNLKELFEK